MAVRIALYNQKGGSGKTSASFQFTGILANEYNKRVLAIDIDSQENLTRLLSSYSTSDSFPLLSDVMQNRATLQDCILPVLFQSRSNAKAKYYNVDLIGAGKHFIEYLDDDYFFLKNMIAEIESNYDYIIFDCPTQSEVSVLMVQTLIATDYIIVPCSMDNESTDGYGALLDTVVNIKAEGLNNNLSVIGMFYSAVGNSAFEQWMVSNAAEEFGEQFLGAIRCNKNVRESRHFSRPLTWYKKNANVTDDYRNVLRRILNRISNN